jgi:mRNA-degrading endonuclease toxin of MazEF toxin-antitoxin module
MLLIPTNKSRRFSDEVSCKKTDRRKRMEMQQKIKIPISILGAGSVIEIDYPYEDKHKMKRRPAVVISYENGKTKVVLLKISSVEKYSDAKKYPYAYKIRDLTQSGLPKPSYVLTDKELLVPDHTKCEGIGRLSQYDLKMVHVLHNKAVLDKKNTTQTYRKEP